MEGRERDRWRWVAVEVEEREEGYTVIIIFGIGPRSGQVTV